MTEESYHHRRTLASRLSDCALFLAHFLKHPIRVGVPTQSPRSIAETVREELRARRARCVIELGAGLGMLTSGILEAIPPEERLLCLEREPAFCRRLASRFNGQVELVNADALELPRIMAGTQWQQPDAIVCSVPLVGDFARQLCGMIAEVLPPDAVYLQVTNMRAPIAEFFEVQESYVYLDSIPVEQLHRAVHRQGFPA
jgi:phosphatidylethanolamine/phosphatidyl-N-methylethanolamine N-methyltransferase